MMCNLNRWSAAWPAPAMLLSATMAVMSVAATWAAEPKRGAPAIHLAAQVGVAIISTDGRALFGGNNDGEVLRWDLGAAEPAQSRSVLGAKANTPVRFVWASKDGRWLAAVYYSGVGRLWDLKHPTPAETAVELKGSEGGIRSACFSLNGHWLATGGDNGNVRLWDLRSPPVGQASIPLGESGSGGRVGHLYVTPDSHWLVTGATTGPVFLWDLTASPPAAGKPLPPRQQEGERSVWPDAISPDGRWLVTGSERNDTRLWDLRAGGEPIVLSGHKHPVLNTVFSADSHWLATASSLSDEDVDPTVRVWSLRANDIAASGRALQGHTSRVRRMEISPNSRWLVTTSDDGTARRWDLTAADPVQSSAALRGHTDRVMAVAITPDSRRAATASLDGTVRLWDLAAAAPQATVLHSDHGGVDFVKIGGNGRWLMGQTTSNALLLWDLRDGH